MKSLFKTIGLSFFTLLFCFAVLVGCDSVTEDVTGNGDKVTDGGDKNTDNSDKTDDDKGNAGNGGENTGNGGGNTGNNTVSIVKSGLKFDFSGAKAVAAVDKESLGRAVYSRNARAATDSSIDDAPLLKILADGSFESAITLADNASLSTIKAIYKSPLADSNDIFVVFDGTSSFYDEKVTTDEDGNVISSETEYKSFGQLICIHEDNTIADILKKSDSEGSYGSYLSLYNSDIQFDTNGNLYYMAHNDTDNGSCSVIYKFAPKTNEITQLTAAVSGTNYESFKMTTDGQVVFVYGYRYSSGSSACFLRAIPVSKPNNFKRLLTS